MLEKAKYMTSLPEGFDGVFRFTNFTKDEFKAKWGGIEYTFPAEKSTPMIIPGATPEEVQHIRKKFARELAVQEFYKSKKMKELDKRNPVGMTTFQGALTYTDTDLTDFIQQCLNPLPVGQAKLKVLPKDSENNYTKDSKGRNVTKVLEGGESLLAQGSGVIE